ncbi:hypothetical protein [Natrialba sp. INN-245]|uniref:hypothetical protein n=1 Tax=Natrialba sp. INN-245 TaxID=2690967 RepID=UPI001F1D4D36|nr:hypothetical protein [Natrialba sp. INN-245]
MTPSRRRTLELIGAAATVTVGIAGSPTVTAQETDDLPAYTRWLTIEDDGLEFVAIDWAALEEETQRELEEAEPSEEVPDEFRDDPMVEPVSTGLLAAYFAVGLGLSQYRLGRLVDDDAFETAVEELLVVNDAVIVAGDVDTAEIDDRLTAEPAAEFLRQMERTAEIGEYDVYTPVEEDADAVIAVSDDAIVFVDGTELEDDAEPMTRLETITAASVGDADRATEISDVVAWLVETAGEGDVTVGQYGDRLTADENGGITDVTFEGFEDADGVVCSFTVDGAETATGEFAAIVDDPDDGDLEQRLGASADERSVDVDGNRVTATGTWRGVNGTTVGRVHRRLTRTDTEASAPFDP